MFGSKKRRFPTPEFQNPSYWLGKRLGLVSSRGGGEGQQNRAADARTGREEGAWLGWGAAQRKQQEDRVGIAGVREGLRLRTLGGRDDLRGKRREVFTRKKKVVSSRRYEDSLGWRARNGV